MGTEKGRSPHSPEADTKPTDAADGGLAELLNADGDQALTPDELEEVGKVWRALDAVAGPLPTLALEPPAAITQDIRASDRARHRLPVTIGILAAFVVGSAFSMGLRGDSGSLIMQLSAIAFMLLGAAGLIAGVKLGGLSRPLGVALLATGAVTYVCLVCLQLLTVSTRHQVAWYQMGCIAALLMWAVPGALLTVWSLWGARLPTPLTGGLLGMGIGFFSATFLHLHCPLVSPLHLLMHHGGGIALMGLFGAAVAWGLMRRGLASA